MNVLPLFKSHYSLGRSILTFDNKAKEDTGPDSIIEICLSNKIKNLFLVEDNMSSFLEAYTHCKDNKIKLSYGVRVSVTNDLNEKSEESLKKTSKIVIFAKNNNGYYKLIKLFSLASKEGFYYCPTIDYTSLRNVWDDRDLILAIPFYDSFLFNNILKNYSCVPQFDFTSPLFFIEDNKLPFDIFLKDKTLSYIEKNKYNYINTKSIYYKKYSDFKSYITFRCINNRSSLNKPEIQHLCSEDFCFEGWLKQCKI